LPGSGSLRLGATSANALWTGRRDGDLAPPSRGTEGFDPLQVPAGPASGAASVHAWSCSAGGTPYPLMEEWVRKGQGFVARPWSWLRQVHGTAVVVVEEPGQHAGQTGDALVSANGGACLAVFTADCAAVALGSLEGVTGAVHAGWRGVRDGVVESALAAMARLGARHVVAGVGPCLQACCCEFSPEDLDAVAGRLGPDVRAVSSSGRPALDVPAAVLASLERASVRTGLAVDVAFVDPRCTACTPGFFSHRARRDTGRQALVVWWE
jgi:purine-nucleoside/S-methyl-5'-thioadenosine phosphorylase / adenosine deaminase